ncbi:hypothetical protein IWQ62_004836 [Dispira parvispora]|uniref:Uncharacterized protein n=1 Tax=Dispira parvispora TaxID=1520584 RepID=A0A9W8AS54_9FUNG|nr:hypothetical protein IWQ62_004836 [Dispira parvispora]
MPSTTHEPAVLSVENGLKAFFSAPTRPCVRRSKQEPTDSDDNHSIQSADSLTTTCLPPADSDPAKLALLVQAPRLTGAGKRTRRCDKKGARRRRSLSSRDKHRKTPSLRLPPQIPPFRGGARSSPMVPSVLFTPALRSSAPVPPLRRPSSELPFFRPQQDGDGSPSNHLPLFVSRLSYCDINNPFELQVEVKQPTVTPAESLLFNYTTFEFSLPLEDTPCDIPLETFAYKESPLRSVSIRRTNRDDHRKVTSCQSTYNLDYLDEDCYHWLTTSLDTDQSLTSEPLHSYPVDEAADVQEYYHCLRRRMPPHHVLAHARHILARDILGPSKAAVLLYNHDILNNRCLFSLLDPATAAHFHESYLEDEPLKIETVDELSIHGGDSDVSLSPGTVVGDRSPFFLTAGQHHHQTDTGLLPPYSDTEFHSRPDTPGVLPPDSSVTLDSPLSPACDALDLATQSQGSEGCREVAESACPLMTDESSDQSKPSPFPLSLSSFSSGDTPRPLQSVTTWLSRYLSENNSIIQPSGLESDSSMANPNVGDETRGVSSAVNPTESQESETSSCSSPASAGDDSVFTLTASSPLMVDWYRTCWPVDGADVPDDVDYISLLGWDPMDPSTKPRMTRFNSSCWRMMATENRMIKARKIVSPLKKRLHLPRRNDKPQCSG